MNALKAAIYSKLTSDGTFTAYLSSSTAVFDKLAPEGTATRYCIYSQLSEVDNYTLSRLGWREFVYLVKVVDTGRSTLQAAAAMDRVNTLLTDGTLSISGWTLMYCRREGDIDISEPAPGGLIYQHYGARYRIRIQA